jgi:propionyl-CoA carboxylase alpha chain
MRVALDSFEVEGIGHNLPFLSAVMDHPRSSRARSRRPSSPRNIPEGFDGVTLSEALRGASRRRPRRCTGWRRSGARASRAGWTTTSAAWARIGWSACRAPSTPVHIDADHEGSTVTFDDGAAMRVTSDWTPGDSLARLMIDGAPLVLKTARSPAASGCGRGART